MAKRLRHGLTSQQRQVIRHALGLTYSSTGYRNRYLASGEMLKVWRRLVETGHAVAGDTTGLGTWFAVTLKGFEAVRKRWEKMDREETAAMALLEITPDQRREVTQRMEHAP